MTVVYILLGIAAVIIAAAAAFAFFNFRLVVMRGKQFAVPVKIPDTFCRYRESINRGRDWLRSVEKTDCFIISRDGLRLHAALLPAEGYSETPSRAPRTILCFHGYRGSVVHDFALFAPAAHRSGCNLLLVDHRAHYGSEGKYITFGDKERYDCADWAQYAADKFGESHPLYLYGVSMGAASVMMACGLPLPPSVTGVIADCGYTTPEAIFMRIVRGTYHMPKFPVYSLFRLFCRTVAHFDPDAPSAPEAMAKNKLPVLFVHGEADSFVPPQMSEENFAACGGKKSLLSVPGASHALSYAVAPETYREAISDMFGFEIAPSDGERAGYGCEKNEL